MTGTIKLRAAHLYAVTGIIEQTNAVLIIAQYAAEIEHGPSHLSLIGVSNGGDLEANFRECFGNQFGIIFWVFQRRAARIGRVSNDKRKPSRGAGLERRFG